MIMRYAVDPNHRKLSDRLTRSAECGAGPRADRGRRPADRVRQLRALVRVDDPAVLGAQRLGINSGNGPETILTNAAHARHMPIGELEGLEWQIRLFDGMPEAQQLAQLRETLAQNDQLPTKLAPMLAAWSTRRRRPAGEADGRGRA